MTAWMLPRTREPPSAVRYGTYSLIAVPVPVAWAKSPFRPRRRGQAQLPGQVAGPSGRPVGHSPPRRRPDIRPVRLARRRREPEPDEVAVSWPLRRGRAGDACQPARLPGALRRAGAGLRLDRPRPVWRASGDRHRTGGSRRRPLAAKPAECVDAARINFGNTAYRGTSRALRAAFRSGRARGNDMTPNHDGESDRGRVRITEKQHVQIRFPEKSIGPRLYRSRFSAV